jgi:hypothetical protein
LSKIQCLIDKFKTVYPWVPVKWVPMKRLDKPDLHGQIQVPIHYSHHVLNPQGQILNNCIPTIAGIPKEILKIGVTILVLI